MSSAGKDRSAGAGDGYQPPFRGQTKDGGLDVMLLGSVGILLSALVLIIAYLVYTQKKETDTRRRTEALLAMAAEDEQGERRGAAGGRQARGAGGVRRRNVHDENDDDDFGFVQHMARQQRQADPDNEESDGEPDELDLDRLAAEGVGKKKLAKLAAKAEKRAVREAELAEREERKRRQEEKERKLDEEREQERLAEQEEEERLKKEREEKERREYEQYLEMKKAFAVDDEGQEALDSEQSSNLLQEFVDYVKRTKVVNLDELASHFRLRTEEAVNRVTELLASGQLTGVSDDRGKFIYITEEEMREVARYVDMRGRVSITQLAEASSNLIKLDGAVD